MTEKDVENLRADVRSQIEYTVLCDNYGKDLADEVVRNYHRNTLPGWAGNEDRPRSIPNCSGAETHARLNL